MATDFVLTPTGDDLDEALADGDVTPIREQVQQGMSEAGRTTIDGPAGRTERRRTRPRRDTHS